MAVSCQVRINEVKAKDQQLREKTRLLAEMENKSAKAEASVERLTKQLDAVVADGKRAADAATAEADVARSKKSELEQSLAAAEAREAALNAELSARVTSLSAELKSRVGSLSAELEDKAALVKKQAATADQQADQIAELEDELKVAKARVESLSSQVSAGKEEGSDLEAQVADLKQQVAGLKDDLQTAHDATAAKTGDVEDLTAQLQAAKSKSDALVQSLGSKDEQASAHQSELAALQAQLDDVKEELAVANTTVESLTADVASANDATKAEADTVAAVREEVAALKTQVAEAQAETEAKENALKEKDDELLSSQSAMTELEAKHSALEARASQAQKTIRALAKEVKATRKAREEQEGLRQTAEAEALDLRTLLTSRDAAVAEMKEKVIAAEAQQDTYASRATLFQEDLLHVRDALKLAEGRVRELEAEKQALQAAEEARLKAEEEEKAALKLSGGWKPVMSEEPAPKFGMDDPSIGLLLESCCPNEMERKGLIKWLQDVSSGTDIHKLRKKKIEVKRVPDEGRMAFMTFVLPLLQQRGDITCHVFTKERKEVRSDIRIVLTPVGENVSVASGDGRTTSFSREGSWRA